MEKLHINGNTYEGLLNNCNCEGYGSLKLIIYAIYELFKVII